MPMSAVLRSLFGSGEMLVMPDAYDPISARVIEKAGFRAIQCSGGSIAIASCIRSETELTIEANLEATRRIAAAVKVPVMADGEDGYGDAAATGMTVGRFIEAGAAGINIEDAIPSTTKECRLISESCMTDKILSAREAADRAGDKDFIINARTDALRACSTREDGLREAIRRANRYLEAGADLAFVCYAATIDEVNTLVKEISGPVSIAAGLPYNFREFTIDDLKRCGVRRVSLPMLAILSSTEALLKSVSMANEPDGLAKAFDQGRCASSEDLESLLS